MTFNEYQKLAERTLNSDLKLSESRCMCAMGLAGETGETVDYLKKVMFHGHKLDKDKLISELGDILWYLSGLCTEYGTTLEEVAQNNISKLLKRYPRGFSAEQSINRIDEP